MCKKYKIIFDCGRERRSKIVARDGWSLIVWARGHVIAHIQKSAASVIALQLFSVSEKRRIRNWLSSRNKGALLEDFFACSNPFFLLNATVYVVFCQHSYADGYERLARCFFKHFSLYRFSDLHAATARVKRAHRFCRMATKRIERRRIVASDRVQLLFTKEEHALSIIFIT